MLILLEYCHTNIGPVLVQAPAMAPKFLQKIINKFNSNSSGAKQAPPQGPGPAQGAAQKSNQSTESPPSVPGFNLVWADDFSGPAGTAVDANKWLTYTGPVYNNEIERYTASTANARLSGSGQLYIIPLKDNTGAWTSGRLHGKGSFACDLGRAMMLQASIRLGTNPPANQQGIWPAFWALGDDVNVASVGWPKAGEWDILELTNGSDVNNATLHYGDSPAAHQMIHQQAGTPFARGAYHTWAIKVDRTSPQEKLTWYLDGQQFFQVAQAQVPNADQWDRLAHKPFFPLLNVAVGGDLPGMPNAQTLGGVESGMQVCYVAFYQSS
jgi:beta-glucanase (GH16 family)